jgi:hypothetical protein
MEWYSVDLGNTVVWLPKNRFFYDVRSDPDPRLMHPDWVLLHSLWLYYVPGNGEVMTNAYRLYHHGTETLKPVFKSLHHLVASFAVFERYWRSLPQFWQENVEGTIAFGDPFNDADGDQAREIFDSIVTPTLRKCLPVWCEINPETADAVECLYDGLMVDLDINPYEVGFLDPSLPEGATLWDAEAASLMPERLY